MMRVKICGITCREDALLATAEGADALGFIFYPPSPRAVTLSQAAAICRELPPFVTRVGVFVNATRSEIGETAAACGLDALQFHGDESPEFCDGFPQKRIKAFQLKEKRDLAHMGSYGGLDAWLVDACVEGARGGTGQCADWELAAEAARLGRPIILSGGLTPDNVAEAIQRVRPLAVDACSGVERAPGRKDPERLRAFLRACREITL